ncbi:hypothetical protein Dsin_009770 [Dipteronia sinensis]|uniref:Ubiquitin-like protease family profile domain-containing protein n=1 Tax=Dipteronia sinensis TaxID=43782 RepID=A0AAE0EDS8_9ROSI|nr:hypothetical protein Dsin_009770 [Dipteronia sinensis]
MKNWSSWCLSSLCEGIEKFKINQQVQWEPPIVDKALIPIVCWTNVKIKKCVFRLHTEGGVGSNQVTLKIELDDIRSKVNFLYAKFSSAEDKNLDKDLPNINSHHNYINHTPPNPPPHPPPPGSRPHYTLGIQHPIVEVSSNDTRSLPQHQQTISKSIPSWMKAPIEPTLEEGNAHDLPMEDQPTNDPYHVPPVRTIPSLLDEDTFYDDTLEQESQSSNKRRFINTRSTSKRKPSRYPISPYIAGPILASTKYRYGPFRIGIPLNTFDEQLINYIFAKDLPSSEVIVDLGHLRVTRKNGDQNSLKKSLSKLRESYMYDLRRCEKMQSLDIVLADEIVVAFPTTFSFTTFKMSYAKAPEQPNGFDCGLLLCMFMDDNYPTPLQMKSLG